MAEAAVQELQDVQAQLRARAAAHRRCLRSAHNARVALEQEVDEACTVRTIPRGSGTHDADATPGVDPEVWRLHVRFRRSGEPHTLGLLVANYDAYARSLALRLHRDHEPLEDLEQVAREGLLTAVRRFDPERGLPFPAFATPTILGALRRHYRDRGWAVRVPRRVHELAIASQAAEERLTRRLGRSPRPEELAHELRISVDELLEVQDAILCRGAASLDELGSAGDDAADVTAGRDRELARVDDRLALRQALDQLDERDREVVRLYFFEELSQNQIADRFGVSQMQVSRWLATILRRMRVWVPA
ncbi:MAG: sigma-70 family RNA polymerase sigma factor [Acidimicrobiales bacterium]